MCYIFFIFKINKQLKLYIINSILLITNRLQILTYIKDNGGL